MNKKIAGCFYSKIGSRYLSLNLITYGMKDFSAKAMSSSALDPPVYETGDSFFTGESSKLRYKVMLGPDFSTHSESDV